jgi:hypothetical protein
MEFKVEFFTVIFWIDSVFCDFIKIHMCTLNLDTYTLQLHVTASLIYFESCHAIIRDTNNRQQAGR